jgi:hypothetical protein
MESISGVSLEKYAQLLVMMADCGEDADACAAIAESEGISRADWEASKAGWSAKMQDPSDMGKTAMAFMPLYNAALETKNAGKEPCSLEEYARIHCDLGFRKDANDPEKQIDREIVFKENGINMTKWGEWNSYWTPKVSTPGELHDKFSALVQQNSDRIFGIVR